MFGQYKRIRNEFTGVLTGKALNWGGSLIRPEATGYGAVYFAEEMLKTRGESIKGKTCIVSGSGNVAQYTIEKLNHFGAKAVTLSDSTGFIHDPDGIDAEKLAFVFELKNVIRGRIKEYADKYGVKFYEGKTPWGVEGKDYWGIKCDAAFPSATQNEIDGNDAQALLDNGCYIVSEGANMPTTAEGVEKFIKAKILYGPGKAANAGGVATSGLEMNQNASHFYWPREEVDRRLKEIMHAIHEASYKASIEYGQPGNYVLGANIAGFLKVADSMIDQGLV